MLRLELGERQRGVARTRTAASEEKRPSVVDEGAVEAQAVACRTADQRDLAEPFLERVGQQLFVPEQAVDQQKGEAVAPRRSRERPPPVCGAVVSERHAVGELELPQGVEAADHGGAGRPREAHAGDAVIAAAGRPDLSRGRASDDLNAGEPARASPRPARRGRTRWSRRRPRGSRRAAPRRHGTPRRPREGPARTTARCGSSAHRPSAAPFGLCHDAVPVGRSSS